MPPAAPNARDFGCTEENADADDADDDGTPVLPREKVPLLTLDDDDFDENADVLLKADVDDVNEDDDDDDEPKPNLPPRRPRSFRRDTYNKHNAPINMTNTKLRLTIINHMVGENSHV